LITDRRLRVTFTGDG